MGKKTGCGACEGEGCARRREQEALDLAAEEADEEEGEEEEVEEDAEEQARERRLMRKQIISSELSHWIIEAIESGEENDEGGRAVLKELQDIRHRVEGL